MPVGKKLAVVLSVVITGVSAALFFRKDASPLWFWTRRSDDPFAQQVERRVGGKPGWTAPLPAALAPAAITPPGAENGLPGYQSNVSPVGSLLAPIEGVADDLESGRYNTDAMTAPDATPVTVGGEIRHRVEDGDTLTKLAQRYLGRAEAYREIYEYNRAVLATPDLLPIGAVLRIPVRSTGVSQAPPEATGMVPVPPRPGS